jgi:hydroxymethylpyrimidine pyrophosphatase-like HAD family hydrolase
VFYNGALLKDPLTGATLARNLLPARLARRLVTGYLERGLRLFVYTIGEQGREHISFLDPGNACEEDYLARRQELGDDRFRIVTDFGEALEEGVIAVNANDAPGKLDGVAQELRVEPGLFVHYGPDIYMPEFHWLEAYHHRANKGDAVRFLRSHLGPRRVVCFGDNLNDIEMFEAADEGHAVANAHRSLVAAATSVIGSNRDHGVARYLARAAG